MQKKNLRANKKRSWWRKMWQATGDLQSKVQKEKENDPRTEPVTCVGELDMRAKTKNSLGGPYVFHTTKYGSEDLLGMNTKVSSVDGTQGGGRQQTVQALADSGASASIISWDLAKNINMMMYKRG